MAKHSPKPGRALHRSRPTLPRACKAPARSALLDLSAELRKTIYEFAFRNDHGATTHPDNVLQALALTQSCSQTRAETTATFYTINTFHLKICPESVSKIAAWLNSLSADQASHISRLRMQYRSPVFRPSYGQDIGGEITDLLTERAKAIVGAGRDGMILALKQAIGHGLRVKVIELPTDRSGGYAYNLHGLLKAFLKEMKDDGAGT